MSSTKIDKVASPTSGNVAEVTGTGNISDSGFSFPNLVGAAGLDITEAGILEGATVSTTELNILDGATLDVTELNGLDGLTANKGVATDGSGILKSLTVTDTELDYVAGVTSNVQGQLDDFFIYTQDIAGLAISNAASDTNTDITIAIGVCTSEEGSNIRLVLTSTLTKQLDTIFAAGDNAGGRPSALTEAASTWYHVFLIEKDSDGSIDAYFDTSTTAANIPTGYTAYRRIGSFYNNSSSNIDQFYQYGDEFVWDVPVNAWNLSGDSSSNRTVRTPLGYKTKAIVSVNMYQTTASESGAILSDPDITSATPTSILHNLYMDVGSGGGSSSSEIEVNTNISSQVQWHQVRLDVGTTPAASTGNVLGYIDRRGKL